MTNIKLEPITKTLDKWQASIQLFESKADNTIVALSKFEVTLTDVVEEETCILFKQNSKMPLSKVVATVFEGINENTPPNLLVKLTEIIINTWLGQQASVEEIREYELA